MFSVPNVQRHWKYASSVLLWSILIITYHCTYTNYSTMLLYQIWVESYRVEAVIDDRTIAMGRHGRIKLDSLKYLIGESWRTYELMTSVGSCTKRFDRSHDALIYFGAEAIWKALTEFQSFWHSLPFFLQKSLSNSCTAWRLHGQEAGRRKWHAQIVPSCYYYCASMLAAPRDADTMYGHPQSEERVAMDRFGYCPHEDMPFIQRGKIFPHWKPNDWM